MLREIYDLVAHIFMSSRARADAKVRRSAAQRLGQSPESDRAMAALQKIRDLELARE